jgi:hypothetical protein
MSEGRSKIGIISCSGEEMPAGTISRQAVRRVLEVLRPRSTVTLCLPLFLAGEAGERRFAKEHPTVTVDGCSKLCAKRGTELYSGRVGASLVVTDILGDRVKECRCSSREAGRPDEEAAWIVAQRITEEVDALLAAVPEPNGNQPASTGAACCTCGTSSPGGELTIGGRSVSISGLQLIFQHLERKGVQPDDRCGDILLDTVRIYHFIESGDEAAYRDALMAAYQTYCDRHNNGESTY